MTSTPAPSSAPADDEIDLSQLAAALGRRWPLIAKVAGGALLLSALNAFLSPKVWEGEFQIVLASKEPAGGGGAQALMQNNPGLAGLIGVKGSGNQLETEVKILESPSVLKPVFDYVKQEKLRAGDDVENWRYSDWLKDNLTIELEKGTSVLNLSYRDTDQARVRPVLQRISTAYQTYSGRDRERGISQAIRYLDEQIARYRVQSVASLRRAQQFAIEQDLTALQGEGQDDEIKNALNIEAIRVQAANDIRNVNEQLKQLSTLGDDPEAVMYIGRTIPELASQGLPATLDAMDISLASLRAKFTDKEDSIRRLKERRRVLIETLKKQTFGYLQARRTAAQARMAAAERPKGVLIRYRELLREAARDEATLTKLETERQVLALEQARKQEPWELISTPTLLDRPVAPRKARILALGLLAGLVAGSGAALLADRRSGRVFADDELQSLLPGPLLARLDGSSSATLQADLALLSQGVLAGSRQLALIPLGLQPQEPRLQQLQAILSQQLPGAQLHCSTDLLAAGRCDHQLVVTAPGAATRPQLAQLRQQLELQGRPLTGWLLLTATSTNAA
ncbi:Wzz/FepE/Etk N-terminal domain-containing protein [Synechococcus sp. 8F6]|uniref:GumC family protein n=1 Tax=Synechococcus sp. 8F6 TaxID=2025606 RepID=UPI000B980D5F|nr:Wzz/FepE/Etk N-terminal domain-containing protein [Synechococcus sp. 8F6]